jgi:flagellar basal-body rod modification protein FlgD
MTVSSVASSSDISSASTTPSSTGTTSAADMSSTFLKLLVTQMKNQDPLNPMDNSQVTSQMAQINTVSGIQTLNASVQALSGQFVQMQALQSASLVGHDVVVQGNSLSISNGQGEGGFQLASAASSVKVDILSPNGQVVDSIDLGAQSSGMQSFTWPAGTATDASGLTFRVTAKSGATTLSATPLMRDLVDAVSTSGNSLTLELQKSGSVPYSAIQAFN